MALFSDCHLSSLRIRLGVPYVLRHGHDCEHIFVCTDIKQKLVADTSAPAVNVASGPYFVTPCVICTARAAVVMSVRGDNLAAGPAVYCATCFHDAHCLSDGSRRPESRDMEVRPVPSIPSLPDRCALTHECKDGGNHG